MMLPLALGPLSASPLLTSTENPSNSLLDSGVEAAAAPPRKPFGWDAYWGAADMHAGPSYSFARQRAKIADTNARADANARAQSVAALKAALAYPPLGESAVQTCMPLASQHVKALGTVLVRPQLSPLPAGTDTLGFGLLRSGVPPIRATETLSSGCRARPKYCPTHSPGQLLFEERAHGLRPTMDRRVCRGHHEC